MSPSEVSTLIEEGLLMAFTVIFAVWSLTTYTVRDGKRLISENASLPLGISFGYAYAGSVAMLTGTFDSLKEVMIFGHILSICAMMLLLRPTLRASRITSGIFDTASKIAIESEDREDDDSEIENVEEDTEDISEDEIEEEVVENKDEPDKDSDLELVD